MRHVGVALLVFCSVLFGLLFLLSRADTVGEFHALRVGDILLGLFVGIGFLCVRLAPTPNETFLAWNHSSATEIDAIDSPARIVQSEQIRPGVNSLQEGSGRQVKANLSSDSPSWTPIQDLSRPKSKLLTAMIFFVVWLGVSGPLLWWHNAIWRIRTYISPEMLALHRLKIIQGAVIAYTNDCGSSPSNEQGLPALYKNPGIKKWAGPYLSIEEITDPWGNRCHYKNENGRSEVWSFGPDGQDDTADDIRIKIP